MGLFSKVDRDFPGGIYLPVLGRAPSCEQIEAVVYNGDLILSLGKWKGGEMTLTVQKGQHVAPGMMLAKGVTGEYVYAPGPGVVGDLTEVFLRNRPHQKALILHPPESYRPAEHPASAPVPIAGALPSITAKEYPKEAVWEVLEKAGIAEGSTGEPLAAMLRRVGGAAAVGANAVPVEPGLELGLAMLYQMPEQVFAGLSILKRWLGAKEALLTYPHGFKVDRKAAAFWSVRCAPVSEKYPQGKKEAVLNTLRAQGYLRGVSGGERGIVMFSIQTLREVDRAVMAQQLPLTRVVTVGGDGVSNAGHFVVQVGIPLMELLKRAGVCDDAECVVEGGAISGTALDASRAVVTSTSGVYTVIRKLPRYKPQPCIRCGWCLEDCPARIDPERMLEYGETRQYERAEKLGLRYCIECGICSYICPSHLRILEHIRRMKWKLKMTQSQNERKGA